MSEYEWDAGGGEEFGGNDYGWNPDGSDTSTASEEIPEEVDTVNNELVEPTEPTEPIEEIPEETELDKEAAENKEVLEYSDSAPDKFMGWVDEHREGAEVATAGMGGLSAAEGYATNPLDNDPQQQIVEDYYGYDQQQKEEHYSEESEALENAENEPTATDNGGNNEWKPDVPDVTFDSEPQYEYKDGELTQKK